MRGFLAFIIRYHFTIIFLFLQVISFVLIVSFNHNQKTVFINSSSQMSGDINTKYSNISAYFSLSEENDRLVKENALLKNQFKKNFKAKTVASQAVFDSLYLQNYRYVAANVIQSSVHKTRNYLTIDIGKLQGVKYGSAVISSEGIVGVIKSLSENYAVVLPVINTDFKVSCRIERNQYYGSLLWNAKIYSKAILKDIPFHVNVKKGDSLFTTGFSSIFPTGELVGFVDEVEQKTGENFYDISVDLAVDFKKIRQVYVVDHLLKSELDSLNMNLDD